MKPALRNVMAAIICGLCVATFSVHAQKFPDRPVRFIVPSASGGAPDISSRIVAAELTRQLGKQFVIDNRPGASGSIGTELIARAVPDGYTIGQGNFSTLGTIRSLLKLPYDTDRDLQLIGQYSTLANILAVTPQLPVRSAQELIEYAKSNPDKLLFASTGNGSSMHLSIELFKRMTGTRMMHVPFKGAQQGVTDLIAGQVQVMCDNMSSIGPQVKAGRVRALAVTSVKRSAAYPELSTVAESGLPGFEVVTFGGLVAPAGVPRPIVDLLNKALNNAVESNTLREKFALNGSEPVGGTPEQFAEFVKRESTKWAEVIKGANIKPD